MAVPALIDVVLCAGALVQPGAHRLFHIVLQLPVLSGATRSASPSAAVPCATTFYEHAHNLERNEYIRSGQAVNDISQDASRLIPHHIRNATYKIRMVAKGFLFDPHGS